VVDGVSIISPSYNVAPSLWDMKFDIINFLKQDLSANVQAPPKTGFSQVSQMMSTYLVRSMLPRKVMTEELLLIQIGEEKLRPDNKEWLADEG